MIAKSADFGKNLGFCRFQKKPVDFEKKKRFQKPWISENHRFRGFQNRAFRKTADFYVKRKANFAYKGNPYILLVAITQYQHTAFNLTTVIVSLFVQISFSCFCYIDNNYRTESMVHPLKLQI